MFVYKFVYGQTGTIGMVLQDIDNGNCRWRMIIMMEWNDSPLDYLAVEQGAMCRNGQWLLHLCSCVWEIIYNKTS